MVDVALWLVGACCLIDVIVRAFFFYVRSGSVCVLLVDSCQFVRAHLGHSCGEASVHTLVGSARSRASKCSETAVFAKRHPQFLSDPYDPPV